MDPIERDDAASVGLEQEVRAWLDRNGYRLEMKVAQSLIPLSHTVEQGGQYVDAATKQVREFDVRASWSLIGVESGLHFFSVVAECKNTRAPWVVFSGGIDWTWDTFLPVDGIDSSCPTCVDVGEGVVAEAVRNIDQWGYAVTEKRNPDKGSSNDHAREAVLSAASAAYSMVETFRQMPMPWRANEPGPKYHNYTQAVPVVVTTSPLFACSLDERGEVLLREIEIARVAARPYPRLGQVPVVIARPEAFNTFMAAFMVAARAAAGADWDRN